MITIVQFGKGREFVVEGSPEEVGAIVANHVRAIIGGGGETTIRVAVPVSGEALSSREISRGP